jgi:Methyltransferase domain
VNRSIRSRARAGANLLLRRFGLELTRPFSDYIPLKPTLTAARDANMPVGEYIDFVFNVASATQDTIDQLVDLGVLTDDVDRVCEVGPGTGRYLERVLSITRATSYEIYETSNAWRRWLVGQYGVTAHPADGKTLVHTETESVDLVHAHKVIPGLPIFTVCRYFDEMTRVVRGRGSVVFDVLTEQCLDDNLLEKWWAGSEWPQSMVTKQFAIDFFDRRGFSFTGTFVIPMTPGITEYLVFSRK